MRSMLIGSLVAAVTLTVGGLAGVGPASTPRSPATQHSPATQCVANVDTGRTVCAGQGMSLAQARRAAASGGSHGPAARAAATPVLVAKLYSGFLGQGPSLEINASHACTTSKVGREWTLGNVGAVMNDETSSFRVYNNCHVRLYDQANCPSGSATYPSVGYAGTTNYVGDAMNDRTTCVAGT